jgi:F0F1-type ATP synthase membrane subunit c/vacuolar-type H+-ATPase subunit K
MKREARWQKFTVSIAAMVALLAGLHLAGKDATAASLYVHFTLGIAGVVTAFVVGNVKSKAIQTAAGEPK